MLFLLLSLCPVAAWAREKETAAAQVSIMTGRAGCTVELDAAPAGKTDAHGRLVLSDVEATDVLPTREMEALPPKVNFPAGAKKETCGEML